MDGLIEELRNGWATIRQGAVFSLHATRAEAEEVVRREYTDANGVRGDYSDARVVRLAVAEVVEPDTLEAVATDAVKLLLHHFPESPSVAAISNRLAVLGGSGV